MTIIFNSESSGAEFKLGTAEIGRPISAMFIGMIPGSLIWGTLTDCLGEKTSLVLSLALFRACPS